jgi:hypothetical protein
MVIAEWDHHPEHIAVNAEGPAEVFAPSQVPAGARAAATGDWAGAWICLTAERLLSYADESALPSRRESSAISSVSLAADAHADPTVCARRGRFDDQTHPDLPQCGSSFGGSGRVVIAARQASVTARRIRAHRSSVPRRTATASYMPGRRG